MMMIIKRPMTGLLITIVTRKIVTRKNTLTERWKTVNMTPNHIQKRKPSQTPPTTPPPHTTKTTTRKTQPQRLRLPPPSTHRYRVGFIIAPTPSLKEGPRSHTWSSSAPPTHTKNVPIFVASMAPSVRLVGWLIRSVMQWVVTLMIRISVILCHHLMMLVIPVVWWL